MRTQPCLTLGRNASELLCQSNTAGIYIWEDLKETFPAEKVKNLGTVNESNEKGYLLYSTLLWQFAEGEGHVSS